MNVLAALYVCIFTPPNVKQRAVHLTSKDNPYFSIYWFHFLLLSSITSQPFPHLSFSWLCCFSLTLGIRCLKRPFVNTITEIITTTLFRSSYIDTSSLSSYSGNYGNWLFIFFTQEHIEEKLILFFPPHGRPFLLFFNQMINFSFYCIVTVEYCLYHFHDKDLIEVSFVI